MLILGSYLEVCGKNDLLNHGTICEGVVIHKDSPDILPKDPRFIRLVFGATYILETARDSLYPSFQIFLLRHVEVQ
ncbi:hypothetical protein R1flu_000545 [Riccia fluitans]|uniref:Uncharacterized protein n=1 Tax=Riccia fluitans TaxID=41844 RepID=A0ABD1Y0R2_9MARC